VAIRAVVFDIGGVLEITPDLGVDRQWETRLGLPAGQMAERMHDVWLGGSLGTITLEDVHQAITDRLGLDERQLAAFMADMWREYLGTANTELIEYARGLRPRYRTGILSNSFVGAREREQAAYGFEDAGNEIRAGASRPAQPARGRPARAASSRRTGNCRHPAAIHSLRPAQAARRRW